MLDRIMLDVAMDVARPASFQGFPTESLGVGLLYTDFEILKSALAKHSKNFQPTF